jgi:hypothetical protein
VRQTAADSSGANEERFLNITTAEARAAIYGSNIVTAIFGNTTVDGNNSDDEVPDLIEIDKAGMIRQLSSLSIVSSTHETIPNEQYGFGQVLKAWEPAIRSMAEHVQDLSQQVPFAMVVSISLTALPPNCS